jgi:hypothetical protein
MELSPVHTVASVFDVLQRVKAGAPAFCTNFFPAQAKLQSWIEHGELQVAVGDSAAVFLRKNRDFWHLYFCATSFETLRRGLMGLPVWHTERLVVDLVGQEKTLSDLAAVLKSTGFRPYSRLQRMARPAEPIPASQSSSEAVRNSGDSVEDSPPVVLADRSDRDAVLALLESSFDHYADQLPVAHEVEAALASRQMLAIICEQAVAALLFFETQGFTSTLRYWVVAEPFRSRRFGGALMRHYFAIHSAVRRFILWVVATNENVVRKYQHYGYLPDGLMDLVLVNDLIG